MSWGGFVKANFAKFNWIFCCALLHSMLLPQRLEIPFCITLPLHMKRSVSMARIRISECCEQRASEGELTQKVIAINSKWCHAKEKGLSANGRRIKVRANLRSKISFNFGAAMSDVGHRTPKTSCERSIQYLENEWNTASLSKWRSQRLAERMSEHPMLVQHAST